MHSVPTYGYLIEEKPRGKNPVRRYAYCTDTGYTESFLPYIEGVNLLCMESTFNNAFASVATEKLHCTTSMAATLAKKAHVGELLLTHISARFKEPELLLAEAQAVFPNTAMAADGAQHEVRYFDKIPAVVQGVSAGA